MSDRPTTPLLDTINSPADIRALDKDRLPQLSDELRAEMISAVSVTGGHLGAGLGVVELTVALHHVFDTPNDTLIWDVGHQAYPHKIVTGRRDRIRTLRTGGGLSGFTKRSESEFDPFGAAHSSTSISAAIGFAIANKLDGSPKRAIAVIGDGAMTAGMAYEAMNNAEAAGNRLIVILNDNDMSIAPPVGALRNSLARLVSSDKYLGPRRIAQKIARAMPDPIHRTARRVEEYARGLMTGGTLFEELGFYYVGPVDGHDVEALVEVLENVRDAEEGPMLVHVVTKKGKGYGPAEASADKYHGVVKFDVVSGKQDKGPGGGPPAYTSVFATALSAEARRDDKVVAITAAMPSGTGLDKFEAEFPDRTFDVGIAEQHGVTFAAGLAAQGYRPFCAIYSTFLQRYDQVVHDVAIQNLRSASRCTAPAGRGRWLHPCRGVRLAISVLTQFRRDGGRRTSRADQHDPTMALHDTGQRGPLPARQRARAGHAGHANRLEIGKAESSARVRRLPFSLGTVSRRPRKLRDMDGMGLSTTVADMRFAKPLDGGADPQIAYYARSVRDDRRSRDCGFGAHVLTLASDEGLIDGGLKLRTMRLPDRFQDHDNPVKQYDEAGLNAPHIVETVLKALRHNDVGIDAEAGAIA